VISKTYTSQVHLLKSSIVTVEVDLSKGLHSFSIVGLASKSVDEAKDRVSSAIKNTGFRSPKNKNQKIVVSLSPADIKKEGTHYDLAIAVGYLLASEYIKADVKKAVFIGELSLDGTILPVKGVLPMVLSAKEKGFKECFLPSENKEEASLVSGIDIFPVSNLKDVVAHINEKKQDQKPNENKKDDIPFIKPKKIEPFHREIKKQSQKNNFEVDFSDIKGQDMAKRALQIAISGGHNIVLYGPPGTGKTMLAKASSFLLPDLTEDEKFEVTSIYSTHTGLRGFIQKPPFRSPHHTASYVSLVGGGSNVSPGEITLANKGILFLDELPEFDLKVLESLREPLEEGKVRISRAKGSVYFPASFILIGAMNPCPCGFYGVKGRDCICQPIHIEKYKRKLSGPISDRIDLWVEVSNVSHDKLTEKSSGESQSQKMKDDIEKARTIQKERYENLGLPITLNKDLNAKYLVNHIILSDECKKILNDSAKNMDLSARSYHRVIKVSRTIADLQGERDIKVPHILEALQYRPRKYQIG
jgi:magnesium chelatase family protein